MATAKKTAAKKGSGSKSTFTQDKADEICRRVSEGEPLAPICRELEIGVTTWYDWVKARPELSEAIARARLQGFDAIADECLEIADDARNDWMVRRDEDDKSLGYELNGEHVQRSKLRIETRLKLLAKWDPKRYGEKLALGGADDLPPIKTMTDDQLAARVAALQKKVNNDVE